MITQTLKMTALLAGLLAFSRIAHATCTGYDCYGNPVETSAIGQQVCGPNLSTWVCEQAGTYVGYADTGEDCSCGAPECPADQVFEPGYGCMCPDGGPLDMYGDCATGSSSASTVGGTLPWTWFVAAGNASPPSTWIAGTVTWTQVNASGQSTGPYTAVGGTVSCTEVLAAGGSCY